jgi:hypothetical protein
MKERDLSNRQEIPLKGPTTPHVAGVNPRSTRIGKSISVALSQGALVNLKISRELKKKKSQ